MMLLQLNISKIWFDIRPNQKFIFQIFDYFLKRYNLFKYYILSFVSLPFFKKSVIIHLIYQSNFIKLYLFMKFLLVALVGLALVDSRNIPNLQASNAVVENNINAQQSLHIPQQFKTNYRQSDVANLDYSSLPEIDKQSILRQEFGKTKAYRDKDGRKVNVKIYRLSDRQNNPDLKKYQHRQNYQTYQSQKDNIQVPISRRHQQKIYIQSEDVDQFGQRVLNKNLKYRSHIQPKRIRHAGPHRKRYRIPRQSPRYQNQVSQTRIRYEPQLKQKIINIPKPKRYLDPRSKTRDHQLQQIYNQLENSRQERLQSAIQKNQLQILQQTAENMQKKSLNQLKQAIPKLLQNYQLPSRRHHLPYYLNARTHIPRTQLSSFYNSPYLKTQSIPSYGLQSPYTANYQRDSLYPSNNLLENYLVNPHINEDYLTRTPKLYRNILAGLLKAPRNGVLNYLTKRQLGRVIPKLKSLRRRKAKKAKKSKTTDSTEATKQKSPKKQSREEAEEQENEEQVKTGNEQ